MRLAARFMSALLIASLLLPSLLAGSVAADDGNTASFDVSGLAGSVTAGVDTSITVTALDPLSAPDTTYVGTVHVIVQGGAAHADYTFTGGDNGVHTFNDIQFQDAGSKSVTITSSVDAPTTGSASTTVVAAAADHLVAGGFIDPTVSGASHTLTVTARDAFNNVATGYTGTVRITSDDGLANLPSNHTYTGGDAGTHGFSVTLNTAGTFTITATDTVDGSLADFQGGINVTPGAAHHLTVTGFSDPIAAGNSDTFTVTARDAAGNVAPSYLGTVTFTSSDPQATFDADYTFLGGDGGHHQFNGTLRTAGTQSITATDTVTASINGTQNAITVTPLAATHLGVSGYPASTAAGASHNVTVNALDTFDNVATGYAGNVTVTAGPGGTTVTPSAPTALTSGTGTFGVIFEEVGAGHTISASGTGGVTSGSQTGITVNGGALDHLVLAPSSSSKASNVGETYTAEGFDAFDNDLGDVTGATTFTIAGGTCLVNVCKAPIIGAHTVTGTDSGKTGTATLTVTPGPATHFAVAGYTSPATAGAADGFTVTALDAAGNTATGYVGTVDFTSSDPFPAVLPSNYTFLGGDAGVHLFSATFKTAGTQSITATDTVTASITGSQAGIAVNAGTATHLAVTGFASPITAGLPDTFFVTALDAFDNTATGYAGTVHFTSSDPFPAALPSNYAFVGGDAGVHQFGGTLKTAGTQSITATDTVTASINGTQAGITVTAAAATHYAVTGFADPVTAGVGDSFVVTALDAFNNTATGYVGTAHITINDGQATIPADHAFTGLESGVHIFAATLRTAGIRSITATDTVTASITGTQSNIDVNAAAAATLTVAGFTSPTVAGVNHSLTVTAHDAFNNVADGYAGTVTFTSSDGAAVLPGDYTFTGGDNGIHLFGSVNLRTVGAQTITATDTVSSSITGAQSGISVTPAAAASFSVTGYPSPATSGVAHNVTVTALDAFGNTATGYAGTVHITSSDGGATVPANNTLASGVRAFSVTLNTAGNQSIIATDTVTSSITGSQDNIAVDPGPVDHIVISPSTASILATDTQLYTAAGFDAANNDLGDFTSVTDFSIVGGTCVKPAAPLGPNNECSAVTVGAHTVTGHELPDDVSDTATLTILNSDPVAVDDTPPAILEDAGATTIDVLANDTDINLDSPLVITGKTDGALGTVVVNVDGSNLTYTPDANANGSDTFTYDISDGNGGTATATVHVTITPVNDAPTFAVGTVPTIPEQTSVSPKTVAGLATGMSAGPADEAGAQNLTFTISNNATTLFSAQPSVDILTGDLHYTPAVNRNGVATVTLVLHDDGGIANGGVDATTHTFTITITGSNHTPFAINDAFTVVSGSHTTALPVLTNDNAANQDVGEVLHIVNVTQGLNGGVVTIIGGGTGLTYKPKSGFIGTDFFTYRVKDAALFSTYATVVVHVPKDTYKPTVTAPVQAIGTQTMGSSTINVHLSWTGTDLGSGIARYELWSSTDGHSYRKIVTTAGTSANVTLTLNHVYRFRVRATDLKGNIGSYAYGPTFKFVRYEESSAVYTSTWLPSNSSVYSGGHARSTSTLGATATLTTTGRTFSYVGVLGPTRGTADVFVDGVLKAHLSLGSSTTRYKWVVYSITFATSAAHAFRIVYTGASNKRADLDAIIVLR